MRDLLDGDGLDLQQNEFHASVKLERLDRRIMIYARPCPTPHVGGGDRGNRINPLIVQDKL
jgi:hypothetical protein